MTHERHEAAVAAGLERIARRLRDQEVATAQALAELDAIRCLIEPFGAKPLPPCGGPAHSGLVDRATAADLLGVSPRTVSRLAASGELVKVGRRYTQASIIELKGRTS